MPRPDKRFIRYPRQGPQTEPEVEDSAPETDAPPSTYVKGRHMVVPRPSDPPSVAAETPRPVTPKRHSIPGQEFSKYDRRPTSGAIPTPDRSEEPEIEEPAASAPTTKEPTEVVFDLRESDRGFEGTYWKQDDKKTADEQR